jgi:Protein of unknown function (DUF2971)
MINYVDPGTYLFRYMDHRSEHFWNAITDILSEQKLFLNSRINFNDPFDSQPVLKDDVKRSDVRRHFERIKRDPLNPDRHPLTSIQLLNLMANGKFELRKDQIRNVKEGQYRNALRYLDQGGLLSFSLTVENPLLWGHYAAAFSGVCVVFKRNASRRSALSLCAKISYVKERPTLPISLYFRLIDGTRTDSTETADKIFSLSYLHKDSHWSHEQEARIFYPFRASTKIKFERDELIAIILGPKSPIDLEIKLKAEIRSRQPSVSLHKAALSQTEFKIIIPHSFSRLATIAA